MDTTFTVAGLLSSALFGRLSIDALAYTGPTGPEIPELLVGGSFQFTGDPGTALACLEAVPVIGLQPSNQTVSAAGQPAALTVAASGSGALSYQWYVNGVAIAGATSSTYSLASAQPNHSGVYFVRVTSAGGGAVTSNAAVLLVPFPGRLLNLSTRALCLTGDDVLIPGFVIQGTASKRLLLRAVGPTLGKHPFTLGGVLPDPRVRLLKRNATTTQFEEVATNDNWGASANPGAITQTGADVFAFPLNDSLESALVLDLAPGEYTVIAGGVNDTTGLAIVELYDADAASFDSRLINISNRGFCGTGDQVMIPGFVISSEGPRTLLVRVVGPGLSPFGVAGTMADPKLEIYPGGASTPAMTNDNWGDDANAANTAAVAQQVSAFALPAGSKDAAVVVTLQPGAYTVVGSSTVAGGSGVVLVEVYVVP